jgi:ABC-type spermidine/putrescine transport system permease subunit II
MGPRGGFLPGGPLASIFLLALFAATLIVLAIAFYRLYQKAGFSGAIGLLMLIPVVNLGVALYLAFAEWPVLAELARAKLLAASAAFAATTDPMRPAMPSASADATGPAVPRTS